MKITKKVALFVTNASYIYILIHKTWLEMPKIVNFGEFLKYWSFRSNSVTRQVNFSYGKNWWKCLNSKTQMRQLSNFQTIWVHENKQKVSFDDNFWRENSNVYLLLNRFGFERKIFEFSRQKWIFFKFFNHENSTATFLVDFWTLWTKKEESKKIF